MKDKKASHSSPGRDEDGVRRFVESFGSALVEAGMPQMPALVFVALLASDNGALTAEQLGMQLGVSRAAVSGAVKYLTHVGLITRERQPGTRQQLYVLESPSWYEQVSRRERLLERWISTTREGVKALGPHTPAGQRLNESLAFWEFLREEMGSIIIRWQERQLITRTDRPT